MSSQDTEAIGSVASGKIENEEWGVGDVSQLQSEPASNLVVLRNDDNLTRPALFDSIIAAPMHIQTQNTHTPIYSE